MPTLMREVHGAARSFVSARAAFVSLGAVALLAGCTPKHPENPALDAFPPGVDGSTEITYYDVHGRTAAQLVAQLRQLGPRMGAGNFWAETLSPMRWTYRRRNDGGERCSLADVHILVATNIIMPRWVPPVDTEPGVYAAWNQSMAALESHEIGHKDISARAAREVLSRLNAISTDCGDIPTVVKRTTDAIMTKLSADQARYDAETRHGLTQGAVFPPRRVAMP
jgi:predicted secreted Zn-dependent protease